MPNVANVLPLQDSHVARLSDGELPALQDSHAVCLTFATLPGSLQRVQLSPVDRTVPAGHVVQLLDAAVWCLQSRSALVHMVPGGQMNGCVQDVFLESIILGGKQS